MAENGPFGTPFLTPKIPTKKFKLVPFLRSFPGNEAHKLFAGGGQKVYVEKFMCFFRPPKNAQTWSLQRGQRYRNTQKKSGEEPKNVQMSAKEHLCVSIASKQPVWELPNTASRIPRVCVREAYKSQTLADLLRPAGKHLEPSHES